MDCLREKRLDRILGLDELHTKHKVQGYTHSLLRNRMGPMLSHLVEQLSFDQFLPLLLKYKVSKAAHSARVHFFRRASIGAGGLGVSVTTVSIRTPTRF